MAGLPRRRELPKRHNQEIATRLLVVQHAEKEPGPGDPGITVRGRSQAGAVASSLGPADVVAVYSSPLLRARQTAESIAQRLGLDVTVDPRLVERANWTADGQSFEQFRAEWRRASTDRDFRPSTGDASRAAGERLRTALVELGGRHPGATVVVVSHGGVTVDLARNLIGDDAVETFVPGVTEEGVEPGAITELSAHGARIEVQGIGQVGWRPVGWLTEPALDEVRSALEQLDPALAGRPIELNPWVAQHPKWHKASAVVDDSYLVKFAWSQPAAQRVVHETTVLGVLHHGLNRPAIPEVVAASSDPALLVTTFVPGRPLTIDGATALDARRRKELAVDLATFLADLHGPAVSEAIAAAGILTRHPRPQGETPVLRRRFPRWVDEDQAPAVEQWCEFADEALCSPPADRAFLHGDLHGFNVVLEPERARVRRVADWETSASGDPAFDFRYLPGQVSSTPELFVDVVDEYERCSGRGVDVDRALAWHIRTVLGDALWRSEAGVPLPDGRTPVQWVEDLRSRMAVLRDRIRPSLRSLLGV